MNTITWNSTFDVGIEEINLQHKQLILILNQLYVAMEDKTDRDALAKILMDLINYAKVHFATEEKFMKEYGYPDYEAHKEEHEFFKQKLNDFCKEYREDKIMLYFEMAVYIKNWISNHISDVDKKYAPFLTGKGLR